jgi:Integrase core domain
MQNGYIESFNGRMRNELLNESLFISTVCRRNQRVPRQARPPAGSS